MIGILLIIGFLLLLFLGIPIAFALILPAIVYIVVSGMPLSAAVHTATYSLDSFPLLAVPLFILVGNLMNQSGITTRLFQFASSLVSHWRGGLCYINILTSLIFSGSSGAALADIGGVGNMEIKAMKEGGYKPEFASALTVASATIGPIFPPSIPLIIYASLAETSAVSLLLAGIFPAFLIAVTLMVTTGFLSHYRNYPGGGSRTSLKQLYISFNSAFPALLTPVVLIMGMLSGIFTATEAAAVTVVYILLINLFIYKELTWKDFKNATLETVRTVSVLMIMVAAAAFFTRILAIEKIPQAAAEMLLVLSDSPELLICIAVVVLIVSGMFLESISALVLLTPVIVPPLIAVGVNPVHLGIIVVYTLMLGLLTPPLGLSLFLVSDIGKVRVEKVLKELIPFYIALFASLLILIFFPSISLWILSAL